MSLRLADRFRLSRLYTIYAKLSEPSSVEQVEFSDASLSTVLPLAVENDRPHALARATRGMLIY